MYSDRDLEPRRREVEAALESCDIFFGSLLFDFDQVCFLPESSGPPKAILFARPSSFTFLGHMQVEWLRARISKVPVRLVFESALELMSCTQVRPKGCRTFP